MDIEELSNKIDKYHEEDIKNHEENKKRAKRSKYENMNYIAGGFTLAALGLSVSILSINPAGSIATFLAAAIFFTTCLYSYNKSQKIKVD